MKYKLHFSNHNLKYIMNSKRECLAISNPFVNILNYKLNKNYELNENYRLTIKNIYIKLFLKCPIPIREYLNSFTIFINSSYFKITSSNHKVNMNN